MSSSLRRVSAGPSDPVRLTNLDEFEDILYEMLAGAHRTKVYPWNSEGVQVSAGVNHTWGDPKILIPIDGITRNYGYEGMPAGDLMTYDIVGLTAISVAQPAQAMTWKFFRIRKGYSRSLNATSGFGEASPEKIYIADTSIFQVWDLAWLSDDVNPDGEIRRVDGITTGVSLDCDVAFGNTYTVAQNAKVYPIRRGDDKEYRCHWGKYAAGGVRNMRTIIFHSVKSLCAGDGVLFAARSLTLADPAGVISVTMLYDDVTR